MAQSFRILLETGEGLRQVICAQHKNPGIRKISRTKIRARQIQRLSRIPKPHTPEERFRSKTARLRTELLV